MNIPKRRREHSRLQAVLGGFLALAVVATACTEHPTSPRTSIDPDLLEASFSTSTSSTIGGPVILMGMDPERDISDFTHGTRAENAAMAGALLSQVQNGGTGILVLGAGPESSGNINPQEYWNRLGADQDPAQPVTFVVGATEISVVDFDGYAMIGVPSSDPELSGFGGLTNAENAALTARANEIAAFVNAGGGLLGMTQNGLDDPWGYINPFGNLEANPQPVLSGFSSVIVEQAGLDLGLTQDGMDGWCCWHETFPEFPDFLDVLVTHDQSGVSGFGEAAALGGATVVIPPTGTQACSPGFWTNDGLRNSSWTGTGWDPDDLVTDMFSAAATYPQLADRTLLESLGGGGGPRAVGAARILLRAAVAAVLNEESFGAAYPATSVADLQDQVNAALASEDRDQMLELATLLDWYNNNYEVDADGNLVLDGEGNPVVIGDCPLESESD